MDDAARAQFFDEIHDSRYARAVRAHDALFRADAHCHVAAAQFQCGFGEEFHRCAIQHHGGGFHLHPCGEQVHGRRADEGRHEGAGRAMIDIQRMADLLDIALVHHHQPVGQRHGFHLIMGDEDRCGGETLVQLADFRAHGHTQLGVEVGERLVEQKHRRFADDGAGHGDALALAA
ncbi:hypothetical protein D3C72_1617830 [compost metagenome]